jgi:CRISPR-associated endonuclease Csy4
MDHFINITIKPDAEMRANLLLNKVYTKFHKRLNDLEATDIGVSFPEYKVVLGKVIRIHATENRLQAFQSIDWLGGLSGYCSVSKIEKTPSTVTYRTVSRIQSNMSPAKLRRLMNRGTIDKDDEKKYRTKMFAQGIDNPYLELESSSNGQKHRRYIEFGKNQSTPVSGLFDDFGLSKQGTVPWF